MTIIFGPGISLGAGMQVLQEPPTYLWAWGRNNVGQLGLGDVVLRSSPVQVGALGTWSEISKINEFQSVQAVKTDGTLWSWGRGGEGQLGLGDAIPRSSPVQVGALTNWAGTTTSAWSYSVTTNLLKSDGTAWMCGTIGRRFNYSVGTNKSSPIQVGADKTWAMIGSGGNGSWFGVTTAGALWSSCYGNTYGMSGQNNTTNTSSPAQVGSLTNWAGVYPGNGAVIARKTDGTLWSWGSSKFDNNKGLLGQNAYIFRSSPVQIGALTNWAKVLVSNYCAQAIKTNGTLWSWGINSSGESAVNDSVGHSSPTQVGALTNWATTGTNFSGAMAVKGDGSLWTWGVSNYGQLGNNTTTISRSSPVQLGALTDWTSIGSSNGARFAISNHAT